MKHLNKRVAGSNFGLSSIRERMAAIGGWLEKDGAIARGTTMTLGLPLEPLPGGQSVRAASSLLRDRVKAEAIEPSTQQHLPTRVISPGPRGAELSGGFHPSRLAA